MSDIGTGFPSGPASGLSPSPADPARRAEEAVLPPPSPDAVSRPLDPLIARARDIGEEAGRTIARQPYPSVAIATLAGLALGLLIGGGRRGEVFYLREE